MRPRFANRGSWLASSSCPTKADGFNEAPIRESGKSWPPGQPNPSTSCFNEAPIRESGKCLHEVSHTRLVQASMRPRFANRGSIAVRSLWVSGGPCFNEAPIRESGKCATLSAMDLSPIGFNEAPIRESGKSRPPAQSGSASHLASMRPRFANRGSTSSVRSSAEARAGFNEAPIRESGK